MYYIYIIKCTGGMLYTGITADISRRMKEHFSRSVRCAKFTKSHKAESLEALWTAHDRSTASKLEWRIKKLPRKEKLLLIGSPKRITKLFPELPELFPVKDYSLDEMLK